MFMKFGLYIMSPKPISTAYFMNPSHQSVSLWLFSLSLLGNGSVKLLLWHTTKEELLDSSFSICPVSYQKKVEDQFFPEVLACYICCV
jgi:hypothetical protein